MAVYVCIICRFESELDDVIAPASGGRCVCLRCFSRETRSTLSMPKALRLDISATLSGAGAV